MKISDQYDVAERMPAKFKPETWQGENDRDNVTVDQARRFLLLIGGLGANVTPGLCAALSDAALGPIAPALPLELIEGSKFSAGAYAFSLELRVNIAGVATETVVSVGASIDILDGPQGSASERLASMLTAGLDRMGVSRSMSQVILAIEACANGAERAAADLINPFLAKPL